MANKLVSIQIAAAALGVVPQTLRRWEADGRISPVERTLGGRRRFDIERIRAEVGASVVTKPGRVTAIYIRHWSGVGEIDKQSAERSLVAMCTSRGWVYEIIVDDDDAAEEGSRPSGITKARQSLLDVVANDRAERVLISRLDALARIGAETLFALCEIKHVEIVVLNQSPPVLRDLGA